MPADWHISIEIINLRTFIYSVFFTPKKVLGFFVELTFGFIYENKWAKWDSMIIESILFTISISLNPFDWYTCSQGEIQ
jgi:hypothetical protein